jgi:hypothetical protein
MLRLIACCDDLALPEASVSIPGRDMDWTEREGEDGMDVTREAEVPED